MVGTKESLKTSQTGEMQPSHVWLREGVSGDNMKKTEKWNGFRGRKDQLWKITRLRWQRVDLKDILKETWRDLASSSSSLYGMEEPASNRYHSCIREPTYIGRARYKSNLPNHRFFSSFSFSNTCYSSLHIQRENKKTRIYHWLCSSTVALLCVPWVSSTHVTWKLVRNADSLASPNL